MSHLLDSPLDSPIHATLAQRRDCLAKMGIHTWVRRAAYRSGTVVEADALPMPVPPPTPRLVSAEVKPMVAAQKHPSSVNPNDTSTLGWEALEHAVKHCTACPLHHTRTQGVFGVGNRTAEWLIVGEAPGEDEDRQGEPFVGRAGQLLDQMIRGMGLRREEIYIANVLKSRPPGNRTPAPLETAACLPYLQRQIELLEPRIILAAGSVAAQHLLATSLSIGVLRGRLHRYGAQRVPLVATYHPSYLLRSPSEKRKAWDDLRLAWRIFHSIPPDGQDL